MDTRHRTKRSGQARFVYVKKTQDKKEWASTLCLCQKDTGQEGVGKLAWFMSKTQDKKEWASSLGLCQRHRPQRPHHVKVSPRVLPSRQPTLVGVLQIQKNSYPESPQLNTFFSVHKTWSRSEYASKCFAYRHVFCRSKINAFPAHSTSFPKSSSSTK